MEDQVFDNLKCFLNKYIDLTDSEFNSVIPYIEITNLKKGDLFIGEGEVANQIAFTNKGYLRVFYNYDGEEITRDITPLNTFATALPSFINQTPSYEIISAITDCELYTFSKDSLEYLYDNYPKWERLGRRVIEDMFVEVQQRLYLFITETAEVRYKHFVKHYPDMIQEVPLKYIADFLGIKIQSLSRLRKNIDW